MGKPKTAHACMLGVSDTGTAPGAVEFQHLRRPRSDDNPLRRLLPGARARWTTPSMVHFDGVVDPVEAGCAQLTQAFGDPGTAPTGDDMYWLLEVLRCALQCPGTLQWEAAPVLAVGDGAVHVVGGDAPGWSVLLCLSTDGWVDTLFNRHMQSGEVPTLDAVARRGLAPSVAQALLDADMAAGGPASPEDDSEAWSTLGSVRAIPGRLVAVPFGKFYQFRPAAPGASPWGLYARVVQTPCAPVPF
jgi:hypothetical protein